MNTSPPEHNPPGERPRPAKGDLIELTVSDLSESDECFGRLEGGLGVFLQGLVAVGDRVRARVFKVKRSFIKARVEEVLDYAPVRTEPCCAHFGVCGGCKWQHVTYQEQLRLKRKRVVDSLEHIGGFTAPPVAEVMPSPEIFHYRNKVEFTFGTQRYLLEEEKDLDPAALSPPPDFALGFHAPRQYRKVVDIETCHIAQEEMSTALRTVKELARGHSLRPYSTLNHQGFWRNLVVRSSEGGRQLMVNLVTSWHEEELMQKVLLRLRDALGDHLTTFVNNTTQRKNNAALGEREYVIDGPGFLIERLGGLTFQVSANSFFQTNSRQAEALYDLAREMAGCTASDTVYDFYCGTGSIALFLARQCEKVLGLEVVTAAVKDARENAKRNEVRNVAFEELDLKHAGEMLEHFEAFGRPDVAVVDPPRAGVHPKVVGSLLNLQPRRVVYVSCNPASLARDGQALCAAGSYTLKKVVPVDMFPHTNHIESVACFDRC